MKLSKDKLKQIIKEELSNMSREALSEELAGQPAVLQQLESLVENIDNLTGSMSSEDALLFLEYLKKNIELRIERSPGNDLGPEETPGI